MPTCPIINECPFFEINMKGLPKASEKLRKTYCHANFASCARFQVDQALGSAKVPTDLYPSMNERAQGIIQQGGEIKEDFIIKYNKSFLSSLSVDELINLILELKQENTLLLREVKRSNNPKDGNE